MSENEKPLEDMTPEEIESLLIEGMHKGEIEFAGMKDNDISVSITKQGEKRVHDLLGGVDVAEVSHVLYNALVKYGALGFKVEATFLNFTIISQLMSIVKHYGNWDNLVEMSKREVKQ